MTLKICKVEGCNCKVHGKGYCDRHYRQFKRYGEIRRTRKDPNEIIIYDGYAEIILYDDNCKEIDRCKIDIEDVEKVKGYKWSKDNYGYCIHTNLNIKLHRYIMNCPEDMVVDHINHDTLDNRKENLRICTKKQNERNIKLRSNNISGYTGVGFHKETNKWRAYIQKDNKLITLGLFENKKDAIKARKEAEKEYFGEFRNKYDN